jgi:hypothetical protein
MFMILEGHDRDINESRPDDEKLNKKTKKKARTRDKRGAKYSDSKSSVTCGDK